jgi:hypothetical protein
MYKKFSILIIVIYLPLLKAQDAHYWTNHYGTDAQLLGGLVVGSVNDLSSTFYNPGAISLTTDERLILSTDAVEFIRVEADEGLGSDNPGSTQTRPTPGIFAYRFMSDSLQKNHFAFSVVIRRNFDYEFENVFLSQKEIVDIWPGIENYVGENYLRNSLNETWVGFSWSRKLSDNIGLGITQYVAVRSQHARTQNISQLLGEFDSGNSLVYINRWSYWHARLLWKLGYIYSSNKFSYGITLTTPSISILGNASSFNNFSYVGNDVEPTLVSSYQEDVSAVYKSPLSVALGARYRINNTQIYFSAEYFSKVPTYNVIDISKLYDIGNEQLNSGGIEHKLKEVINFGLGIGQVLSESISLYASFITNNSGLQPGERSDIAFNSFNIYHFSLGSSFSIYKFKLTLGLGLGFGASDEENIVGFETNYQEDGVQAIVDKQKITYRSIKLLLGFSTAL